MLFKKQITLWLRLTSWSVYWHWQFFWLIRLTFYLSIVRSKETVNGSSLFRTHCTLLPYSLFFRFFRCFWDCKEQYVDLRYWHNKIYDQLEYLDDRIPYFAWWQKNSIEKSFESMLIRYTVVLKIKRLSHNMTPIFYWIDPCLFQTHLFFLGVHENKCFD